MGKLLNRKRDQGASLVEFALLMPLLLLLVLGIIEFGFVLGQMNEIRHGAREGARYAAVSNEAPTFADVRAVACDAINLPGAEVTVQLSADGFNRLDYGTIRIVADISSLSGAPLIRSLLPSTLTNEATFRLEQDATWEPGGSGSCP